MGLFGIGLDTYWGQFEGLHSHLIGYQNQIKARLETLGAEVVDAGLVDTPEKAVEAGLLLNSKNVELIFLCTSTYALSSTVLPVVQRINAPVILLNPQPTPSIDNEKFNQLGDRGKMTGEWLAHCQACSVPEIAGVFNRAGIRYDIITGHLHDEVAWGEIAAWIEATNVATPCETIGWVF